MTNLVLRWHGPFSVVEGTDLPRLDSTPLANRQGVYFHTVRGPDTEFIHYVGKTSGKVNRTFEQRITKEEFRRKEGGLDWILDPALFQLGYWSEPLYKPKNTKTPDLEAWSKNPAYFLQCRDQCLKMIRVFIAPMEPNEQEIKLAESALMWAVWNAEENKDIAFISNDPPWPKEPSNFRIEMTSPVRFRGLGSVIQSN